MEGKAVEGKTYIIDADCNNGGLVEVVRVYGRLFCRVKDPVTGAEWETMQYRLSEHPRNQSRLVDPA